MERIIIVKTIDYKTNTKGQYLNVTAMDGDKYSIFDIKQFPAFKEGHAVKLTGEMNGKYFNTSKAERVENILPIKLDDKNRVFCLSYAKDITVALISTGLNIDPVKKTIETAKSFEEYITTGEVTEGK